MKTKKKLIFPLALIFVALFNIPNALADTYNASLWSPDDGQVYVRNTSNSMYGPYIQIDTYIDWNTTSDLTYLRNSSTDTFEVDVVLYGSNAIAYDIYMGGYGVAWETNLPSGYLDSQFSDDPNTPTFGIGSIAPENIQPATQYYTSIDAVKNLSSSANYATPMSVTAQRGYCVGFCDPGSTIFAWQTDIVLSKSLGYTAPGYASW